MSSSAKMIKSILDPILKRPDHIQIAALVYRVTPKGIQILTVTSRGTKRWILPKGWPMEGKTLIQAAQTEAWEEAGLVNVVSPAFELGTFKYMKHLETGLPVPVVAHTFAFETDELAKKFPEKGQRKRKWVDAKRAKKLLKHPEIGTLIDTLLVRFSERSSK